MIRIDTCSWKYPSWRGLVYSAARGIDYLSEYGERFNTVEVDQWFWSLFGETVKLPNPEDVLAYRRVVSDSFRFTVKVPNAITLTHHYKKRKSDPLAENPHFLSRDLFQAFLSRLEPLHDVLGPLIFQFEYLNRRKMASQNRFLRFLDGFFKDLPPGFQYGVEIRNPNYLNDAWFEFLGAHGLVPVLIQGYWMPSVIDVFRTHRERLTAAGTGLFRLHGPGRREMEKRTGKRWDRIVEPRDEELDGFAGVLTELEDARVGVYVNVNNHYEGCAPLTIRRLRERLGVEAQGQYH